MVRSLIEKENRNLVSLSPSEMKLRVNHKEDKKLDSS